VVWTLFDGIISLVQLASSSPAARKAERDNIASALMSLRSGLTATSPESNETGAAKGQFSNSALDLFCHQRVRVRTTEPT
jgi:hypothetical protein